MTMFKVARGRGGKRVMYQVNTGEEGNLAHNKILQDAAEKLAKEKAKKPVDRKDQTLNRPPSWQPSSAYRALAEGLYKRPIAWAEKFIRKLDSIDEVDRIRMIEQANPKSDGGREKLLTILDDRKAELEPAPTPQPDEKVAEAVAETKTHACPHCEFVAGSEEGLEAHINAVHQALEL